MTLVLRKKINNTPKYDDGKSPVFLPNATMDPWDYGLDYNLATISPLGVDPMNNPKVPSYTPPVPQEKNGILDRGSDDRRDTQKTNTDNSNGTSIAQNAVGFIESAYNAFGAHVKNSDQLVHDTSRYSNNVGGVLFTQYGNLDRSSEYSQLNVAGNTFKTAATGASLGASIGGPYGAAIGAVGGALVGGIGGIFRANKLKLRIALANATTRRLNTGNFADASSTALLNNYYLENGNTSDGRLFANRGKDLKQLIR